MVGRVLIAAVAAVLLSTPIAYAQGGVLRAYVSAQEIVQDRPFWLIVEAEGSTVEMPTITQGEGVVINTTNPRESRQFTLGGGQQLHTVRISYASTATQVGQVTIPPISARVNGRVMKTDPIVLDVKPAPPGADPLSSVRAWVNKENVVVGQPFWIFVEATGMEIELPNNLTIDGLQIDPRNSQSSVSYSISRNGQVATKKRGFYAVAMDEGEITIPEIPVRVTGRVMRTEPISVVAKKTSMQARQTPDREGDETELTQDDLVFIQMDVDKTSVYQGEPVLLTQQLWRIQNRRITSGPYRGALIVDPTTEGFYVRDLEPLVFPATSGPWSYDVNESRKLLYPTRPGTLTVGVWHWEGIALINRQSIVMRDKLYYKLDAGPIDVEVKPLPPAPKGFTGGVGDFTVEAEVTPRVTQQGVPVAMTIVVRGVGNPDAVGDPVPDTISWGEISVPDRALQFLPPPDGGVEPGFEKTFTYSVTPLRAGQLEVPEIPFAYFNPDEEAYRTVSIGPFPMDVVTTDEERTRLLASEEIPRAESRVEILAEDLRPLMQPVEDLRVHRDGGLGRVAVFAAPVLAYAAAGLVLLRRRRDRLDVSGARSRKAGASSMQRLRGVAEAHDPADELYKALSNYVADAFNVEQSGMTSSDIERELKMADMPPDVIERTVQILRACERARYASQALRGAEVEALISGAEACIQELESRKGSRRLGR